MIYQLLKGASVQELKEAGLAAHYAQHDHGLFPTDASGIPFSVQGIGALGDPVADLVEDLAAEQKKARATYEHLMALTDDPDLIEPLKFLRQREVIHFQRFGEALDDIQRKMDSKKNIINIKKKTKLILLNNFVFYLYHIFFFLYMLYNMHLLYP